MQLSREIVCVFATVLSVVNCIDLGHIGNDAEQIDARQQACNENARVGENDKAFWSNVGKNILRRKLNTERQYGVAKNVIFFLGDGMSIPTLAASRIYMGQMENKDGESEMLSFEKFPYTGLSKTYCVDSQVADSACSATAYLAGVKGNIETIGVTGAVANRDCVASDDAANQAVSSMRWAQLAGKRTGVVTNMRVTHATPAGAYANIAQRNWECDGDKAADKLMTNPKCLSDSPDIARQLIERETGRNLNLIMGGGRKKFLPDTVKDTEGQRKDNRNLIQEWLNIDRPQGQKSVYVGNRTSLNSINLSETDYLLVQTVFFTDDKTYVDNFYGHIIRMEMHSKYIVKNSSCRVQC